MDWAACFLKYCSSIFAAAMLVAALSGCLRLRMRVLLPSLTGTFLPTLNKHVPACSCVLFGRRAISGG